MTRTPQRISDKSESHVGYVVRMYDQTLVLKPRSGPCPHKERTARDRKAIVVTTLTIALI